MDEPANPDDFRLWLDAHQLLWRLDEFFALARFHSWIHDAAEDLSERLLDEVPSDLGAFKRLELTSTGREVGGDIPRWWIFVREANIPKLHSGTLDAFAAAQKLLRSSEKICRNAPPSYDAIIHEIGRFLQLHSREIDLLAAYAANLKSRDQVAPAVLFSYAVWGTTRRGERSLPARAEMSEIERLQLAGELAVGIRSRRGTTLNGEWSDLLDEAEPATQEGRPIAISMGTLLIRTQFQIRKRLTDYFEQVRDSLRHIDALCQEFAQREYLYADDRFVKSLLRKIAHQPSAVETDLWEIKETLEVWAATGQDNKEAAAIRFVEDVVAFANGRGGVMLLGVADKTHAIIGVRDPENRIKHILSMVNKYAEAQADFVNVRAVDIADSGVSKTCIVVVVGETESPVGVRQKNKTYAYPLRVGPGIERASREGLLKRKAHNKGTSFAFTRELNEWVLDAS